MSTNLTESEFQELSNSKPMDLIEITTNEGCVYRITLEKQVGGTWKGIGCRVDSKRDKNQLFYYELRYGKGVDGNNKEPFIAVSRAPEIETKQVEKYVVISENEDIDDFILNSESGTVSYDEYVISLEHYGEQKLKLG